MEKFTPNPIYQAIVNAVRRDPEIGVNSGSCIDECYTDKEIIESLVKKGIETLPDAIEHFRAISRGWDASQKELEVAAHPTDPTPAERLAHCPVVPIREDLRKFLRDLWEDANTDGELHAPLTVAGFVCHMTKIVEIMEREQTKVYRALTNNEE